MRLISNTIYFKEASLQKEAGNFSENYLNSVGITDPYIIYYLSRYGRDLFQIIKSDSSDKELLINKHIQRKLKSLDIPSFLKKKNLSDPKIENDLQHWFNYVLNENEIYRSNPAFQFVLLSELLNIKNSRQLLMEYDGEAIARLFSFIGKNYNQSFNLKKEYNRITNEVSLDTPNVANDSSGNSYTGWVLIKGKDNDPENFEKNCKLLNLLSKGRGWCTGEIEYCEWYLSSGDIYLYLSSGISEVSMPIIGNSVREIKGKDNEIPKDYAIEILRFIREKNLFYNYGSEEYESDDYENLIETLPPEERNSEEIIDCKLRFSTGYGFSTGYDMTPSGMNSSKLKDAQKVGYINRLQVDPSFFSSLDIPLREEKEFLEARFNGYINYLERGNVKGFEYDIPLELQNNHRIIDAYQVGFCAALKKDPLLRVPEAFRDEPDIKESIIEGYVERLKIDPVHGVRPESLLDDPRIEEAIVQGWINTVKEYPIHLGRVPHFIRRDPEKFIRVEEAYIEGWKDKLDYSIQDYNHAHSARGFPLENLHLPNSVIKNNEEIKNKYIDLCYLTLRNHPYKYMYVLDSVKDDERVLEAFIDGGVKLASRLRPVPAELFDHPKVQQACIEAWSKRIEENSYSYLHIPDYLENNEHIKETAINSFLRELDRGVNVNTLLNAIPFNLRKDPRLENKIKEKRVSRQSFNLRNIRF